MKCGEKSMDPYSTQTPKIGEEDIRQETTRNYGYKTNKQFFLKTRGFSGLVISCVG